MNFCEYHPLALRTAKSMPHDLQVQHGQLGMVTELGELADDIKRTFVYGKEFDKVNALVEIGDYCWYLNLFLDEEGVHPRLLDNQIASLTERDYAETMPEITITLALSSLTGVLCLGEAERRLQMIPTSQAVVGMFAILARRWGSDIYACLDTNIAKLAARYGEKYSDYAALNRDVVAERKVEEAGAAAGGQA